MRKERKVRRDEVEGVEGWKMKAILTIISSKVCNLCAISGAICVG